MQQWRNPKPCLKLHQVIDKDILPIANGMMPCKVSACCVQAVHAADKASFAYSQHHTKENLLCYAPCTT